MDFNTIGQLVLIILFMLAIVVSSIVFLGDACFDMHSPFFKDVSLARRGEWKLLVNQYWKRTYGAPLMTTEVKKETKKEETRKEETRKEPLSSFSLNWVQQLLSVPVLFIYGGMGSGKTTIVHYLAREKLDKYPAAQLCVIVPKPEKKSKGLWWGLPVVSVGKDVSYDEIKLTLLAINKEVCRRQGDIEKEYPPLYVVVDDIPDVSRNCKNGELTDMINKVCTIGRTLGVQLVLISQSNRVAQTGFAGLNDILLDTPTIKMKDRRGYLSNDGDTTEIDTSFIEDIKVQTSRKKYDIERLWKPTNETRDEWRQGEWLINLY